MTIKVDLNLPPELEFRLCIESGSLEKAVREGFLLDLFRRGIVSRAMLSHVLGLDRFETYTLLKRHQIYEPGLTHDELDRDLNAAEKLLASPPE